MFAERTTSFLHICKFIFILKEKLAAFVAVGDGYIRHHIFVVFLRPLRAKLRVVNDINLLVAHAFEDSFVNFNRFVLIWVYL